MKKHILCWLAGVLAGLVLGNIQAVKAAVAAEVAEAQDLFDGKTLQGWVQKGGKARYQVEDGCIVGTTVLNTPNSFLCTEKEYGNFILDLDFKVHPSLNSGIQIRSQSLPDYKNGQVHGYQVEIDPSARAWSAGIYDEGRRGWLVDLKDNEPARKAFRQNEWNHYRIEAIGDTMKTWINGVPAATLKDSMTPRGFIALQVHNSKEAGLQIRWRNLRLQAVAAPKLKALIIDGQNNHDWKGTTPGLRKLLEETGLFEVAVATTPGKNGAMDSFKPDFSQCQLVVLNYNGTDWSKATQNAFEDYVRQGGGVVVFHAADNAFPNWPAFNEMIGLGGWGGRNEKSGPMVRYRDGKVVLDNTPGPGGTHGPQHEFLVEIREPNHPITAGLPARWLHTKDELYSKLRGPAKNLTVLATAFAAPQKDGTGENEPVLFTIQFGQGRIFHTALGHAAEQLRSVGFIITYQRGAEWAATGKVTLTRVPADFPTAEKSSTR